MTNTTSTIVIPASSTGVVAQTLARAAGKTFLQAFLSAMALTFSPWLIDLATDIAGGGTLTVDDLNFGAKLIVSAALGAFAAVISFAMNFFGEKTLPAGESVVAQSTK